MAQRRRAWRQRLGQRPRVLDRRQVVLQPGQPGALVGREDAIGRAGLGQNFSTFEDDVVLAGVQGDAQAGELAAHGGVARNRLRLVIVGREHRLHAELAGQRRHFGGGRTVAHDQPGFGAAGQRAQLGVELQQRRMDELNPAVGARQGDEDVAVEDKDAVHLPALLQCQAQGRVVVDAQITPEPHQPGIERFMHVRR